MPTYRAAISFPLDTALPRDQVSIHPHFIGDNPGALASALKANLIAHPNITTKPFNIKVYDAQHAPPSYPLAVAEQTGTTPNSGVPREITLCLSFFSGFNRPSYRGRLYMPYMFFGGSAGTRPTALQQQAVVDSGKVFYQGLPTGHQWVVFSKKNNAAYTISDLWCDDEWDIQRSRGLRGTSRLTAKVA